MMQERLRSGENLGYFVTVIAVMVVVATLALFTSNTRLALATSILGLYVLHLASIRFLLRGQRRQRDAVDEQLELLHQLAGLEPPIRTGARPGPSSARGGGDDDEAADIPVPHHFALGTVALVRGALTPEEVASILTEQRRHPEERFGALALKLGFLSYSQLESLLLSQQEGLFTDEQIHAARERLEEYRRRVALPTNSLVGEEEGGRESCA